MDESKQLDKVASVAAQLAKICAATDAVREMSQEIESLFRSLVGIIEELSEEIAEIEPKEKLPRPPKKIGPGNKPNYAANNPQKRARSNC